MSTNFTFILTVVGVTLGLSLPANGRDSVSISSRLGQHDLIAEPQPTQAAPAPSKATIEQRVIKILAEKLNKQPEQIRLSTRWDSLGSDDFNRCMNAIGEEFDIEAGETPAKTSKWYWKLVKSDTFGDTVRLIEKKTEEEGR